MTRQRISAIVTCHDLGRTLREALHSVQRQTRPPSEIVVVDDRSSDLYTRRVLADIEREGICVLHTDRGSASGARNAGARATDAPYLVWLDADDVVEPRYFERAANTLDGDASIDFVSCAIRAFGAAHYEWQPANPTFVEAVATGGVPHASSMIRRAVWNAVGGFDESLSSFELLDFWASVLERGCRGVVLEEPLLNYRVRASSGYRRSLRRETYLERLRHFYEKHRQTVEDNAAALIAAKEAFFLSQREYQRTLERRIGAVEGELRTVQTRIDAAVARLREQGLTRVDRGDLRRTTPISPSWGRDRGTPIDRYYIERFLDDHRSDIHGRVLEVRDSGYTTRFGGTAVSQCDVIDIEPSNGRATVIADLRDAVQIPSDTYDCIVLTQTLQLVDDMAAVVRECARMLRPGGVVLATAPGIIRVDEETGPDRDYWRLTEASARRLFADAFPPEHLDVVTYGNVAACTSFLYGLSVEELPSEDLEPRDARFPLVVCVRAVAGARQTAEPIRPSMPRRTESSGRALILAYHRVATLAPDSHRLCTPAPAFEQQMAWVSGEATPIALDELLDLAAEHRIPERAVAVTLDDGYIDALTTASPILESFGIPATFFINSDRLEACHERWWDVLERIFLCLSSLPSDLDIHIDGRRIVAPTATAADRMSALERLNETAWTLDAGGRHALEAAVVRWSGADLGVRPTHRVLTSDEIRQLATRPGHAIGSHTVNHLALTTHPRETKQVEIAGDKKTLENVLGAPVRLFSYPYGDFDAEVVDVAREAGFVAAVTVEPGCVSPGTNRLLLPRYEVTPEMHADFPRWLRDMWQRV